ncbi:ATP-grasp domain-containing protein (plasmid) [Priestia megaterium]|uniref:ATP-grasp domain-containing protein n=1 Tax=Priestia megaterium TaxID=1404 RepID=UPI003CFED2D1
METLIYISDFRLPNRLEFIAPLKKYGQLKKILLIEKQYEAYGAIPEGIFDEIIPILDVTDRVNIYPIVRDIQKKNNIIAILTPGENAIETGGYLRSKLGIQGMQQNQSEAVRNKWIMKEMVRQRNVQTCRSAIATSSADYDRFVKQVGYPIIVKPLSGFASINTFKISSAEELYYYLNTYRKVNQSDLLEEFIHGKEFHCDSIVHNGKVVFSSVSQYLYNCIDIARENKPPASITFPISDDSNFIKQIKEVNEQVISALGINNSVCHGEYFLTSAGEVVFGEIGARIGGADVMPPCIKNTHGIDFFDAVIDLELKNFQLVQTETDQKYTGMICLPSKEGTVKEISSVKDFADVSGIVDFNVYYSVDQQVNGVNDTMTRAGFAIVEGENFDDLKDKLLGIYNRFNIVTV